MEPTKKKETNGDNPVEIVYNVTMVHSASPQKFDDDFFFIRLNDRIRIESPWMIVHPTSDSNQWNSRTCLVTHWISCVNHGKKNGKESKFTANFFVFRNDFFLNYVLVFELNIKVLSLEPRNLF